MPRDDWAKYARRDRGRKAVATGTAYYAVLLTKKLNRKKKWQRRKPVMHGTSNGKCNHCGSLRLSRLPEVFKDGSHHVRVTCVDCGRFVKFGE